MVLIVQRDENQRKPTRNRREVHLTGLNFRVRPQLWEAVHWKHLPPVPPSRLMYYLYNTSFFLWCYYQLYLLKLSIMFSYLYISFICSCRTANDVEKSGWNLQLRSVGFSPKLETPNNLCWLTSTWETGEIIA